MSRGRMVQFVVVLLAIALLSAACSSTPPATQSGGTSGTSPTQEKVRIGAVVGNLSNPAVSGMVEAMKAQAAKYPNLELIIQDSRGVEEQVSKAETMLAQGVKVLALHPWEGKAVMPLLQKATEQKVAVAILIDDVPGAVEQGLATTFISGDETEGGSKLGEWLAKTFSDGGKAAVITGTPGNLSAEYRTTGFKQGLSGNSNWEVVAEQTANWQRDQGLRVFTDLLTAHPDIRAVFANNDEMAFGALQAVRASGKQPYNPLSGEGDVVIMGYNGTCIGLEATYKGEFAAEGVIPFQKIGSLFVDMAEQVRKGESVEPHIKPEILALDSKALHAIVEGTAEADADLKAGIEKAAAGQCS